MLISLGLSAVTITPLGILTAIRDFRHIEAALQRSRAG